MRHDNVIIKDFMVNTWIEVYIVFLFLNAIKFWIKNMLFFPQSPLVQAIFSRDTEEVTFLLNHNEDASSLVMLSR